jgi:uncharacterized protein YjiS (DUF1127 family)
MAIKIGNRRSDALSGIGSAGLLLDADGNDVLNGGSRLETLPGRAGRPALSGGLQHERRKQEEGFVVRAGTMGLTRGGRVLNALAHMQAAAPPGPPPLLREGSIGRDAHSRVLAVLRLPATWLRRAHFRAQLRHLIEGEAGHLRDVGFDEHEARAEAARFFWQPVRMKHGC